MVTETQAQSLLAQGYIHLTPSGSSWLPKMRRRFNPNKVALRLAVHQIEVKRFIKWKAITVIPGDSWDKIG